MRTVTKERGVAMIATLLVMMLMSALLVGFTAVVISDQQYRFIDRDRNQAFYGASAGLEKLTADLGNLFFTVIAPTNAQVQALAATAPSIPGISFTKQDGTSGYTVSSQSLGSVTISSGPYQGLIALMTLYTIDVTARTATGGEVHLQRQTETVAIPVFQFGMFSDVDLAFFAGSDFGFGGRVHTNGNLFLSQGGGTLTLSDKVTAVKEVVRQYLENGSSIDTAPTHTANVNMAKATNSYRLLARTEGSVVGTVGSALNDPTWTTLSLSTYNSWIRNGRTGAKALNLPLLTVGGTNPDLIRRPASTTENTTNAELYGERLYTKVSLRILLSDASASISTLPGVSAGAPVSLEAASWPPAWYAVSQPNGRPNLATSLGYLNTTVNGAVAAGANKTITLTAALATLPAGAQLVVINDTTTLPCTAYNNGTKQLTGCTVGAAIANGAKISAPYLVPAGTSLVGGFIKIEMQSNAGVWSDVTQEILSLGISEGNDTTPCATYSPNAIIRFQRLREGLAAANCTTTTATDFWPLMLFDAREGLVRDNAAPPANTVALGGVMSYIEIDVNNLKRWFQGAIGVSGTNALNNSNAGYAVYFSDRRGNNVNGASQPTWAMAPETAEYGWEDIVNPGTAAGTPNGTLDAGEDVNGNGLLETYGKTAQFYFPASGYTTSTAYTTAISPVNSTANAVLSPTTTIYPTYAQSLRVLHFRRALKLVNGSLINFAQGGLTIVSENPVYIQGDYNANSAGGGFNDTHVPTSVMGDSVTLLSSSWNDNNSFANPYNSGNRLRPVNCYYRTAIISGKNPYFPYPTAFTPGAGDFGTDGGAHNFLRYLEGNNAGGTTVHYLGSIATFFYSRQATGFYKSTGQIYAVPTRDYQFDTDFLNPATLPPLTPVFRDVNTVGFYQEIRPGK